VPRRSQDDQTPSLGLSHARQPPSPSPQGSKPPSIVRIDLSKKNKSILERLCKIRKMKNKKEQIDSVPQARHSRKNMMRNL
jgi:hypothetical protein